jgi:hypothetical protein
MAVTVGTPRAIQERVFSRYLNTVWSIASSRYVGGFVIGYTSMSAKERFNGYRQNGFEYLVILADQLSKPEALALEKQLQDACKAGAARGAPYKRKYDPDYRNLPYYQSAGQGSRDPHGRTHSVYMAWWEPV